MAKGDPVRFVEAGTEETVELARTLNYMSNELEKVDKMQNWVYNIQKYSMTIRKQRIICKLYE